MGIRGEAEDTQRRDDRCGTAAVHIPVWIWQGEADTTVLPVLAQELAGKLPHCSLSLLPGEGHLLLVAHWREMLQTLERATVV
jgi:pimeloyl-ACP methyl ester carboxylesterase